MLEAQEELVETSQPDSVPDLAQESSVPELSQSQAPTPAEAQVMELEKLGKFKFEGKEWTARELRDAHLKDSDYRQKTAAIKREKEAFAREKEYVDNLPYDLDNIRRSPHLAQRFKEVYPKHYHKWLDYALSSSQSSQVPTQQQPSQSGIDPEFRDEFNQMKTHYQEQREALESQKQAALISEIDSKFEKLAKLYPFADEDAVTLKAEVLAAERKAQGYSDLSDLEWDQLWKSSHEFHEKRYETRSKQLIESQKQVNQKSRDVPSGGGIPAPAVKQPRTIKEASELARRALDDF